MFSVKKFIVYTDPFFISFLFKYQKTTSTIIEYINSAQEELNVEDFNQLIDILAQRKEEKKYVRYLYI